MVLKKIPKKTPGRIGLNKCLLSFLFFLSFFLHERRGYIFGSGMRGGPKLMFSDKGNRSGNNHTIDITSAIDIISAVIIKSSTAEMVIFW